MVKILLNPNYQDLLKLRFQLLRPDLGSVDNCVYAGDNYSDNFHVGAVIEALNSVEKLIAIASFHLEKLNDSDPPLTFRLRGMATHPDFFRKGIGRQVLSFGINEALRRGAQRIWFNAREGAIPFYQSLEFKIVSEKFEIPGIGPHFIMKKDFFDSRLP